MAANSRPRLPHQIVHRMLDDESVPPEAQVRQLQEWRAQSPEASAAVDEALVTAHRRQREGLTEARGCIDELREIIQKITSPPLQPALFLGLTTTEDWDPAARVCRDHTWSVVPLADEVDPATLRVGDEVLLSAEGNLLVARAAGFWPRCGETATFDRYEGDRAVLRCRDEEHVVLVGAELLEEALQTGDQVLWDRQARLALTRVARSRGEQYFLLEAPDETYDQIGGLDGVILRLKRFIEIYFKHVDLIHLYRLRPLRSVLLTGPPGTGKTMLARATARWMAELLGMDRPQFIHVKAGSLNSMWYGETERNYRELFRVARETSLRDNGRPIVMFFDEVDSVGASRGETLNRVDDRVLTAFMEELNGMRDRGNILLMSATNRSDALDPALLRPGRLGDLILKIPRPDMRAARAIFGKHLWPDIPYAPNGHAGAEARQALIESALSRLYAPNGDGDLARLMFRDGKERIVKARDLMSGAHIARISQAAAEEALWRHAETGERGIRLDDLLSAIEDELDAAASLLTPANCRRHLSDLPQDVDVVKVEPIRAKPRRITRYLDLTEGEGR